MTRYGVFITISLNEYECEQFYISVKAKTKAEAKTKVLKLLKKVTKMQIIKL